MCSNNMLDNFLNRTLIFISGENEENNQQKLWVVGLSWWNLQNIHNDSQSGQPLKVSSNENAKKCSTLFMLIKEW
jgi:hypothetical protein